MKCLDDKNAKPQLEEQIDQVAWKSYKEAKDAMDDSYESVKYVLKEYKRLVEFV